MVGGGDLLIHDTVQIKGLPGKQSYQFPEWLTAGAGVWSSSRMAHCRAGAWSCRAAQVKR